jgi:hypothetical protein
MWESTSAILFIFPPRTLHKLCNVTDLSQICTALDCCSWFLPQWAISEGKSAVIIRDNTETYLSAGGSVRVIHLFSHVREACETSYVVAGASEKCAEEKMFATIYLSMALQSFCWTSAAFSASWSYTQSVGILRRGISRSQGRYLQTE